VFPDLKEAAPLPFPLKLPDEVVLDEAAEAGEEAELPVLEPEPVADPVVEALGDVAVVEDPDALTPDVNVVLVRVDATVVGAWAIANWPLWAKTWLMLETFTALRVYCESAGTMGHKIVSGLADVGSTLLARARELPNDGWFNSRLNVGSLSVAVHETSERKPEVTLVGAFRVRPRAKWRTEARTQNLANILIFVIKGSEGVEGNRGCKEGRRVRW
jgi:hypothetical protein